MTEMEMEKKRQHRIHQIAQASHAGQVCIRREMPEKAVDYFIKAYTLAREVGEDQLERTCAMNLGAAYIEAEHASEAIDKLNKAWPPDEQKDSAYNGDLYFNFAKAYEAQKKYNDAFMYYQKASEEFRTDPDKQIECLTKCAQLYADMNNNAKAVEVYEHIHDIYKFHGNSFKQASCWCEIAARQIQAQHKKAALNAVNKASEVLKNVAVAGKEEFSNKEEMAGIVFNDLGLVYLQLLKYDEACFWFKRALLHANASPKNKHLEALVLQNMGAVYNVQGNYQSAVEYHQQAADAYAKLRSRISQGQCFNNMAIAYLQLGNIDAAEIAFNHALQAAKDCDDAQTIWQALEELGCMKFNQGNYEKAQELLFEALDIIPKNRKEIRERVKQKLLRVIKENLTKQRFWGKKRSPNSERMTPNECSIPPTSQNPLSVTVSSQTELLNHYAEAVKEREENEGLKIQFC